MKRDFAVAGPNELWVADITYISTWTGFLAWCPGCVYPTVGVDAFLHLPALAVQGGALSWTDSPDQTKSGRTHNNDHPTTITTGTTCLRRRQLSCDRHQLLLAIELVHWLAYSGYDQA